MHAVSIGNVDDFFAANNHAIFAVFCNKNWVTSAVICSEHREKDFWNTRSAFSLKNSFSDDYSPATLAENWPS